MLLQDYRDYGIVYYSTVYILYHSRMNKFILQKTWNKYEVSHPLILSLYFQPKFEIFDFFFIPDDAFHIERRHNDTSDGHVIRFDNNSLFAFASSSNSSASNTAKSREKRSIPDIGIYTRDHYVELLVVADAHMQRYHGENLEQYVLTLISIVSLPVFFLKFLWVLRLLWVFMTLNVRRRKACTLCTIKWRKGIIYGSIFISDYSMYSCCHYYY